MEIERVRIQNFRSILDLTVELGDLTILIGANGTGKTTVLDALDLFASERTSLSHDDFLAMGRKIVITLHIRPGRHDVPERLVLNGRVELQKSFRLNKGADGKRLMAASMCNRDFDGIRGANGASEIEMEIMKVRKSYPDLPQYMTKKWRIRFAEYEHRLSRDPKYRNKYYKKFVAVSKDEISLPKMLEVVMVPTARDISADGKEGSDSYLSRLMDLAIRSAQKNDRRLKAIADARDDAHSKYTASVVSTIRDLNRRLDLHSERYITWAKFTIDQEDSARPPASPSASVRMRDGGFMSTIDRAGSGAQRVYLLSLLDTIASILKEGREGDPEAGGAFPTRLIAIDEPELYQHPQRQQRILRSLTDIVEADPAVRIVCSTHSPYFVRLKRVHSLRLLQKSKRDRIRSVRPERLARLILPNSKAGAGAGTGELAKWLDMSATRWVTEGFFASLVVITEGQGDRNMLLATASAMGADLDRHEITMVPATGVDNVERFARLFGEFRIPVYLVWDRDGRRGKDGAHRKDAKLADVASGGAFGGSLVGTVIKDRFACIRDNLTVALSRDLEGCEDVLGGSAEYSGLMEAMDQDRLSAQQGGQKCHKCGAARAGTSGNKTVHRAQKDFLNNRLNVLGMLEAVREKGGYGRLEAFTTARIVRSIEKAGKAIEAERARQADMEARARTPNDDRADSMNPNSSSYRASEANRKRQL